MDNKTLTILIGNSDDKLSQKKWAEFCKDLNEVCESYEDANIHFSSSSHGSLPWQNYCVVVQTREDIIFWIKRDLDHIRNKYNQDSIAIIEGETEFIGKG